MFPVHSSNILIFNPAPLKVAPIIFTFFFKEYDTGVLVATVIGCVALLIAIVGIVYCCQRSQKTHQIIAARSAFSRIRSTLGSGVDSLVPEDEELDDFDEYKDNADEKEKGESDDEKYIAK